MKKYHCHECLHHDRVGKHSGAPSVYAESISDLEKQKESIQEKRSGVESNISDTEKKIDSLQDKQMTAEDQIAAIEAKIAESAKKSMLKMLKLHKRKRNRGIERRD
ncbi:hypothetical protein KEH51_05600 [[Brevibacterium] frigoritolerans]|uniref:Uncharacterized protein n=1 Tax=Peribacillus frigoritolerans TaxID=450367 RepID=A0A941FHE4_9BACI|nr:hypothetical protein [Peribacillus frigoritolerans]